MLPLLAFLAVTGATGLTPPSTPRPMAPLDTIVLPTPTGAVAAEVHPGMELLAIMAYLSQRYPTPPDSRYKSAVWAHFKRHKHHPALESVKAAWRFPDFTEMGLMLRGYPRLRAVVPDSSAWFTSMGKEQVVRILRDAVRFAADTRFPEFRRTHAAEYARWSEDIRRAQAQDGALTLVERFYRAPSSAGASAKLQLFLEPLNDWGAHQVDSEYVFAIPNDGVVRFMFGPSNDASLPDSPLTFSLGRREEELVWHEAGHFFVRGVMREHATRIAGLQRLFDSTNANLQRQGIKTWSYAFEETLVRAVVASLLRAHRGPEAGDKEMKWQAEGGFVLVPAISTLLSEEYLPNRATYPTFEAFAPRIFALLEARQ